MVAQHKPPSVRKTGRCDALVDLTVLAGVFVGYLLVRIAWTPTTGFARFHLTDLLAGLALPSLASLALAGWPEWRAWLRSLRGRLAIVLGAAIVWEGAVPLLSDRSTADPIDVLCYVAGALLHHLLLKRLRSPAQA